MTVEPDPHAAPIDSQVWEIRIAWSRKIAKVLRHFDIDAAVKLVADELTRSGAAMTNGELMVRIFADLADRIELLPYSMANNGGDADPDIPLFSGVDAAVENGVIKLYGNGDKLIADLLDDHAEILRDMLGDGIKARAKQRELMAPKGSEAS